MIPYGQRQITPKFDWQIDTNLIPQYPKIGLMNDPNTLGTLGMFHPIPEHGASGPIASASPAFSALKGSRFSSKWHNIDITTIIFGGYFQILNQPELLTEVY